MRDLLTISTSGILAAIGLLHAYWACGGRLTIGSAVPSVNGVAVFTPSAAATWLVALALAVAATIVAAAGGLVALPVPAWTCVAAAGLLAFVFAARAVGDFGLVGFFKTRGDGAFASLDSWVYSPLCMILSAAIVTILATRGSAA